jgi:hypothetical protein
VLDDPSIDTSSRTGKLVIASQPAWGMYTVVRLAASHRDDLRCNHSNSPRSPRRQVKHSILRKRSAVVHSNVDRLAIAWVADDNKCQIAEFCEQQLVRRD